MSLHPAPTGSLSPGIRVAAGSGSRALPVRVTAARLGLAAILSVAFGLRVAMSFAFPEQHHPDETYQAFEQGYRYAFGYGVRPWEFEIGLRSTLLPFALSLVFRATDMLGVPAAALPVARIALATLSLLPVAAIYAAGLRRSLAHAVVAGVAAATWCELVLFSYRPLTEAIAADFLLTALALGTFRDGTPSRRVLAAIGGCLACVLMLRIHFAPAVMVIALGLAPWRHRAIPAGLALGAAGPLALFALADVISWGVPFWPPLTAILVNIGQDVASRYGVSPPSAYLAVLIRMLLPVLPLLAATLVLGARSYRVWLLAAAVILLSHSAIPHKEYRFVFVVGSILVVAAAFASADLLTRHPGFVRAARSRRAGLVALVAGMWAAGSLVVAVTSDQQEEARSAYRAEDRAFGMLARRADLCGLLLDDVHASSIPGYASLGRRVPIYQGWRGRRPSRPPPSAYNYIFIPYGAPRDVPGYETAFCVAHPVNPGICTLRRDGPCDPETDRSLLHPEGLVAPPDEE